MAKKRWNEDNRLQEVDRAEDPEPTSGEDLSALMEVYRMAESLNGHDHMRHCSYYIVGSGHCDCGLHLLRQATAFCRGALNVKKAV